MKIKDLNKAVASVQDLALKRVIDIAWKTKDTALSEEFKPDTQFKVAIFPWELSPEFKKEKEPFVEAFTQTLLSYPLFIPTYSSYELGEKFKVKRFDDDITAQLSDDKLWVKQGFFAKFMNSSTFEDSITKEPNVDSICQIEKKLKADAVLIYHNTYLEPLRPAISVFLIDVNGGKCYTEKYSEVFKSRKTFFNRLKMATEKVFKNFQENNLPPQIVPQEAKSLPNKP